MYSGEVWRMRLYFGSLAMKTVLPQKVQCSGQPIDQMA
jgi:hypothetical protein